MYTSFEDYELSDQEWDEILSLMCELDFELLHKQPPSTYSDAVALAAAKNDPDTPTFKEALSGDNREDFREAMVKEVSALKKRNT